MDELRGPNIQIILHVKEGLGFGFLRKPFIVSGSLNGYMLETDPMVPTHAPAFDAELVWEADKRRFRSLRIQNVPIKIEVYTTSTQGRKDKIGYILLSLLGAQPCPSNKLVDVKYSWHKLLGIRSEGKCCHPQLLMSLTIQDRVNNLTPRNELRMFHSNEVAYPSTCTPKSGAQATGSILLTFQEYINESKKTVTSPDLQPQLMCDDGLIQIGTGEHMFVLSFVIGSVENLDLLLPNEVNKEVIDCFVTYCIFTHNIMTDRVGATKLSTNMSAMFNQRTSLRLRSDLAALGRYFTECPNLVVRVCIADKDAGICSIDLRKLIPIEDVKRFVNEFCNADNCLIIHERCYLLRCDDTIKLDHRRPYIDVEISLKYIGVKPKLSQAQKPNILNAQSVTQLERSTAQGKYENEAILDYKSGSCTQIDRDLGGVAYMNKSAGNTARYKTATGENVLQTNEITDLLRKMYETFTVSQEKLASCQSRPLMSDMQIQCDPEKECDVLSPEINGDNKKKSDDPTKTTCEQNEEKQNKTYSIPHTEKDTVKQALSAIDRDAIMKKFIDELEDWKEMQQELFKCQLKRKEKYHLELLSREWEKRREELETKLSLGVERCRTLANDLSRATEDFRLRGYRNTERERKLLEAKKALEAHYTAKYQELREASQKMEDDMHHQIKLKDMRIEELELKIQQLEKHVETLKNNLRNMEKEAESKHSGLTKDQTASLIQELRCLEEKLDSAMQSKAFFKEQWGRAVRELHLTKMSSRRHMLSQLRQEKSRLNQDGLDTIEDYEMNRVDQNETDIKKLKDDFYANILANTPPLDSHSVISTSGPDGFDTFAAMNNDSRNTVHDKLSELIMQRDQLIQQENPDEVTLKQLNNEIRSILINCGS